MLESVLPAADPIPLPAPYWVFKTLLIVTFILHVLAMNCMLGSSIIAITSRFRSASPLHARLAIDLGKRIPSFLAATVTLGIAPLLFVQVLYGQFFYSSSALMAWPWLAVVGLVIIAYYSYYVVALSRDQNKPTLRIFAILSTLLVLTVAFIYTNNFTLMLQPAKWKAKYLADPGGFSLNLDEPMIVPRFLHSVIAALAIAGLSVLVAGLIKRRTDRAYGDFAVRQGGMWFIHATMVQFVTGIWYLVSLPQQKMMLFLGKDLLGTTLFGVAVAASLAAVMLMLQAVRFGSLKLIGPSLGAIGVTIVCMQLMRDRLRMSNLQEYFRPEAIKVSPQWDISAIFFVLFLAAVALWLVMMKRYFWGRIFGGPGSEVGHPVDRVARETEHRPI